ncbi:MAG TPA: DUF3047 domain-containing protein [Candidatus Deferrimicrobiaceae bacterium]
MGKNSWRRLLPALFIFTCLQAFPAHPAGADAANSLSAAGWEETTPGRWSRLAERKADATGKTLSAEFVLSPGSGVAWEKKGSWTPGPESALSLEFTFDGTNPSSDDYKENGASFPVFVTAVFGRDSEDVPFKTRIAEFFRNLWHGFPPGGIRLTYAVGNRVPEGSMYRMGAEQTVFILAGEEEKGKTIQAKRNLREDFIAAYGRPPEGPVTRIVAGAQRPSKEKGNLKGRVVLTLP